MDEPQWLSRVVVDRLHHAQLSQHGGRFGVNEGNALESALARPKDRLAYEPNATVFDLAAAYGFGLARNRGYRDGNKRIALVAMAVFLRLNGHDLVAPEAEVVVTLLSLAAGELSEADLAEWLQANSTPIGR